MGKLSPPSPALIARIEKAVDYENRFIGGSLHLRAGVRVVSLYRLEEVFMLLYKPHPRIDLNKLHAWIGTVVQDEELARGIKRITKGDESDVQKMLTVRDMIGMRILQCRQSAHGQEKSAV
jgi:hypothetical protein